MGYNIHNIYPLIHDFDDFPSSQRASRRPVASSLWTSRLSARPWRRSTPRGRWPWPMPRSASLGEPKDVDVKKRFVLLCFFGGWLWVSDCEIVVPKWTFFLLELILTLFGWTMFCGVLRISLGQLQGGRGFFMILQWRKADGDALGEFCIWGLREYL